MPSKAAKTLIENIKTHHPMLSPAPVARFDNRMPFMKYCDKVEYITTLCQDTSIFLLHTVSEVKIYYVDRPLKYPKYYYVGSISKSYTVEEIYGRKYVFLYCINKGRQKRLTGRATAEGLNSAILECVRIGILPQEVFHTNKDNFEKILNTDTVYEMYPLGGRDLLSMEWTK